MLSGSYSSGVGGPLALSFYSTQAVEIDLNEISFVLLILFFFFFFFFFRP